MDEDWSKGSHFTIPTPTQACAVAADSEGDLPRLSLSVLWLGPEENEGKTVKPKDNHHFITCTSCKKTNITCWSEFFVCCCWSLPFLIWPLPQRCSHWNFVNSSIAQHDFIFIFTLLIYQDAIILHWSESLKWSSFWLFYSMLTAVGTVKCDPNPWAFILIW